MSVPRVEVVDLSIGYDDWRIDGFDLSVAPGEIVAITGPSGCGKSTLLKTILGAVPALAGRVLVDGVDLTSASIRDRGVGIVFQEPLLFPQLDVFENVAYGLRRRGDRDVRPAVEQLLELVHLPRPWDKRVDELSGGQMQRVALARALAPSPRVLLLDEPLSALDFELREALAEEIRSVVKAAGAGAIHVTHDLAEADRIADRVLRFEELHS